MTNSNLIKNVNEYTHSIRINVTLTATVVHLDTVVPSTSRTEILWYIVTVPQINATMNITFPEGEAPWKLELSRCRDKYTLALS